MLWAQTFHGGIDASGVPTTKPFGESVSGPAACSVGSVYRDKTSGAYRFCIAANTWTDFVTKDAAGYTWLGWINTTSGDAGTGAMTRVYASNDAFIRYYQPAEAYRQMANAKGQQWTATYGDGVALLYNAPRIIVQWLRQGWGATVTRISCVADTGQYNITIDNNGANVVAGMACNNSGNETASLSNTVVAAGTPLFFSGSVASGSPHYVTVVIGYTQN
jgi:hypothetical protein